MKTKNVLVEWVGAFSGEYVFLQYQGSLIVIKRPYKMNFYIIAALLKPIYTIQSGPQKVII